MAKPRRGDLAGGSKRAGTTGIAGSVAGRPHSSIALTTMDTSVRQQEVESLSLKDPNPSPGRPYPVRLLAVLISLILVSGRRVSSNEGRPGRLVYGKCGMQSEGRARSGASV
jgi:hypothetical protein